MGVRYILLLGALSSIIAVPAQDATKIYSDILNSKNQMMASVTIGMSPANFIDKDLRLAPWKNFQYNSQFMQYSFGMTDMKRLNDHGQLDTVLLREWTIGGNLSVGKWAIGKRLYDIRGTLMLPTISAAVGRRRMEGNSAWLGKVTPGLSFQFPYFGIDLRLHSSFHLGQSIPGLKNFALTPEIGIKFDGLYSLLDAQSVFIGNSKGTYTSITKREYFETKDVGGGYYVSTKYTETTTRVIPYDVDRYATLVGSFGAVGPHISFQSLPHAGVTRMGGLGYYLRLGMLSSDFLFDTGKIGFASSMQSVQSILDPSPKGLQKVNKKDFSNGGSYTATRFQARIGIDLYEILAGQLGPNNVIGRGQTKFTRIIGGIGYGYALVSNPRYLNADGLEKADERFENDYTLMTSSGNHAKFAKDGTYLSLYCSIEAGALRLTFETNRYFQANLANVSSISLGYLFPYGRIAKKMKAIKSYKAYLRENSK